MLKIQGKNCKPLVNFMDDDSGIAFELHLFVSNMRREVCGVLDSFFFNKKIEERKYHNMFFMLDLRFKILCLLFSFVGQNDGVSIVDECDRKTLYPMLWKCYHHLHPMIESIGCVDEIGDEDFNLDIFQ